MFLFVACEWAIDLRLGQGAQKSIGATRSVMANLASISEILKRATDAGDVPGVAAAVATADGPIFEGAYGKRDLASGAAMTPDTVVRIASMTKAITGACAMQLVEQGKLDLDRPI